MPIIVLQLEAQIDLDSIDRFSRQQFGSIAADHYMAAFDDAFSLLSTHPELGAPFSSRRKPVRSYKVGQHRLFYYFDGQRVVVVRVLHHAMKVEKHLGR